MLFEILIQSCVCYFNQLKTEKENRESFNLNKTSKSDKNNMTEKQSCWKLNNLFPSTGYALSSKSHTFKNFDKNINKNIRRSLLTVNFVKFISSLSRICTQTQEEKKKKKKQSFIKYLWYKIFKKYFQLLISVHAGRVAFPPTGQWGTHNHRKVCLEPGNFILSKREKHKNLDSTKPEKRQVSPFAKGEKSLQK